MKKKSSAGFSMLEVLLAIIVTVTAGVGVYEAFNSGLSNNNMTDVTDEVTQIANVYTDLASSNLTSAVPGTDSVASLLKNSGRLSSKYFTADGMTNFFGALTFTNQTPYGFTVAVPLGCLKASSTMPVEFNQKVQDLYSCGGESCCDATTHVCSNVTPCQSGSSQTVVTLDFSINN